MFKKEDFCTQKTSMFLKDAGYNDMCRYTYCKNYRVRDEILEKHPGLSDDGYLDLTEEYGGPYKRSDVYARYTEILEWTRKNSMIEDGGYELCTAPTIQEAMVWLIQNTHKVITPKPYICEDGIKWLVEIRDIGIDKVSLIKTITCKETYSEAANAGIEYVAINYKNI